MRIILATPILPPDIGGPAQNTVLLAERLAKLHEVVVIGYSDTPLTIPGVRVITIPKKAPLLVRIYRFYKAVLRELTTADIVYAQNAVAAGLPALRAALALQKPCIIKFVGDEAWERARARGATTKGIEEFLSEPHGGIRTRLFMAIQGYVLRRATFVTTPSAYLLETIIRTYGIAPEKTFVNYNAAEVTPRSADPVPDRIATIARLTSWKGVDGILEALVRILPVRPSAHLMIAGDGPERKRLEDRVRELQLGTKVVFLGSVSGEMVHSLLSSSSVFVLNSLYEGLPISVLESFSVGTPVVATNIKGTNEVVFHERTGLLVPPRNPELLADALLRVFTDARLCEMVTLGATTALNETFSWDAHVRTLIEHFRRATRAV